MKAGAMAGRAKGPRGEDANFRIILYSSPAGMKIYQSQARNQAKVFDYAAVYSRLTKITNGGAELDN
jgi:hypothetical protein